MYLEQINQAGDIKKLKGEELAALAQEIREFLIEKISKAVIWHPIWVLWS